MNILDFAKKKEQFSIDLYTGLAGKTQNEGLKNIFMMLVEEEKKHYRIVSDMAKEIPAGLLDTPVLKNASSIFKKMQQGAGQFIFPDSEIELYEKAGHYEKESRDFYLQKASETTDALQKQVFKRLAAEEQKHFVLLDNICDFVSRPLSYLEDAQFVHLENYTEEPF
jgi:rubrerythrin